MVLLPMQLETFLSGMMSNGSVSGMHSDGEMKRINPDWPHIYFTRRIELTRMQGGCVVQQVDRGIFIELLCGYPLLCKYKHKLTSNL